MGWRDYRDLLRQMEQDMQRFAEDSFFPFGEGPGMGRFWQPAADIHETEHGIVIKMEMAGLTTDNVNVSLTGDGRRLTVTGMRAEGQNEREKRIGCHQLEIYFGPFERTFNIPTDFQVERDQITATLKDGFLTIHLPRKPDQPASTQTIPIVVSNTE